MLMLMLLLCQQDMYTYIHVTDTQCDHQARTHADVDTLFRHLMLSCLFSFHATLLRCRCCHTPLLTIITRRHQMLPLLSFSPYADAAFCFFRVTRVAISRR